MFGAQWKLEEEEEAVVPMVAMLANAGPNDYWRRMWRQEAVEVAREKPAVDEVSIVSKSYRRTTAAVTRTTATPEKKEEREHQRPPQSFSRTSKPMKIGGGREIAKPTEIPKKLQGHGRRRKLKNTNGHRPMGLRFWRRRKCFKSGHGAWPCLTFPTPPLIRAVT